MPYELTSLQLDVEVQGARVSTVIAVELQRTNEMQQAFCNGQYAQFSIAYKRPEDNGLRLELWTSNPSK